MPGPLDRFASNRTTAALLSAAAAASAYGAFLPPARAGAVFRSPAFAVLLSLLFLNLLLATAAAARGFPERPWALLLRLGALFVLAGGALGALSGIRGGARLYEGQLTSEFMGRGGAPISPGFALRLDRFSVERRPGRKLELGISAIGTDGLSLYPAEIGRWTGPEGMRVLPLRYLPDFRMDASGKIASKGADPNNPALEVEVESGGDKERGWLFARFPHFPPVGLSRTLRGGRMVFYDRGSEQVSSYASRVTVLEGGREAASGTTRVNRPMAFRGYRIYQSSYDPVGWQWSGLEIVRDPGLGLVYAGYVLLALGATLWTARGGFDGEG